MLEEIRHRIFEPFFIATGTGLYIVRRLIVGHGGDVRVDSEPGETCYTVRLSPGSRQRDGG